MINLENSHVHYQIKCHLTQPSLDLEEVYCLNRHSYCTLKIWCPYDNEIREKNKIPNQKNKRALQKKPQFHIIRKQENRISQIWHQFGTHFSSIILNQRGILTKAKHNRHNLGEHGTTFPLYTLKTREYYLQRDSIIIRNCWGSKENRPQRLEQKIVNITLETSPIKLL